jgi:hypothetical protein
MVTRHGDATHTMDYEIKDNRLWQEGGERDWKSR